MSSDQNVPAGETPPCSIFEVTAELLVRPDFLAALPPESIPVIQVVKRLLASLGSGCSIEVENSLSALGVHNEKELFNHVGHLARRLHDTLREFNLSLDRKNLTMDSTNLPDAADKLEQVLLITLQAANHTMSNMECQAEMLHSLSADVKAYKLRLPPEQRNDSFLSRLEEKIAQLEASSMETLVAQSYQDLTGQSIKKVIKLVAELEKNLVSLVTIFGARDNAAAIEVPADHNVARPTAEGKVTQDDVDSLLSSFGF